jgi:hypothetical protein
MSAGIKLVVDEYFQILIYNILAICQVYPSFCFEKRMKYSVLLYDCIIPEIRIYVEELVGQFSPLLHQNLLENINVCINDFLFKIYFQVNFEEEFINLNEYSDLEIIFRNSILSFFSIDPSNFAHLHDTAQRWNISVIHRSIPGCDLTLFGLIVFNFIEFRQTIRQVLGRCKLSIQYAGNS